MTFVAGDAQGFAADAALGFCDLYADLVTSVPGGVVRSTEPREGKVALIVGGGAGHQMTPAATTKAASICDLQLVSRATASRTASGPPTLPGKTT